MAALRETVLKTAAARKTFRTSDVIAALHGSVSRQYIQRVIGGLVREGVLVKAGVTRGASYALPEHAAKLGLTVKERLSNRGLKEDEVLDRLRAKAFFLRSLPENVDRIFSYAFTEMLNNAIEHSNSPTVDVEAAEVQGQVRFVVNDVGVGVFQNVMEKHSLNSELEAIEDLLKGKTTTQPERHSGEGIFFTSKMGDLFLLDSHSYRMRCDNVIQDVFVGPLKPFKRGTRVTFSISTTSSRRTRDVFNKFQTTPGEPAFDRSQVKVKLYVTDTTYLSRSQARRLLSGLEKFRSVTLDFEGVETVGQAFADEVFRVFRRTHPEVVITPVNMNEAVRFMVERAGRG